MNGHQAVESVIDLGDNKYLLKRTNDRPDLTVLIADIYIVGAIDIFEINPTRNGIDCIVLVGFFNRYSRSAKETAKGMNVGLFNNREFFGAVNCTGEAFLNYEKKKKND